VKDLARANAFLTALAGCQEPLRNDPLAVALTEALIERQSRYRALHERYGSQACGACPHGGCCRNEFPRVVDLLPRLCVDLPMPVARNADEAFCAFLDGGCGLTPAPLPNICVAFHCGTLQRTGPEGYGAQSMALAAHCEEMARLLTTHLLDNYALFDDEAELDLRSPAVRIAQLARLPLRIATAPAPSGPRKSVPHPADFSHHLLPIV
jgi:hypothetical protein